MQTKNNGERWMKALGFKGKSVPLYKVMELAVKAKKK